MNKQYLVVGQDVIYVGADKQEQNGKIIEVYSEVDAHIELPNGSAIATLSDSGEENTFYFKQASLGEE